MNKKEIEELIKFVSKAGVSEVSIEQKDFKITIKNEVRREQVIMHSAPAPIAHAAPAPVAAPAPLAAPTPPAKETPVPVDSEANYITIKSPMIGTFYRSSSPDKPNFVNVGDELKPGKVIAIIEAMKLFNEIESDVSGKIVKVLVENAHPVEYDQPLYLVDPS
ncbi:MAG: acetyl-CoA carboxylase biotin carboxyl carrier protein [Bacteroidetes bacterium]|nr:acetyl-CoA carboxylase biotin carboxyl carrier protein [Bacteroidota bacterium]